MPVFAQDYPLILFKKFLEKYNNLSEEERLRCDPQISQLFELAILNRKLAKVLLEATDKFLIAIPRAVPTESLKKFASEHPDLVAPLIEKVKFSNELADELQQIAIKAPKKYVLDRSVLFSENNRTALAIKHNANVVKQKHQKGVRIQGGEFVPMVTRHTRNFNQKLCSVGVHSNREILLLDPEDPVLDALYRQLKEKIQGKSRPLDILRATRDLTRACFPGKNAQDYINKQLTGAGGQEPRNVIALSELISEGQGVCRHHTLLNAYFLSRLTQDNLLSGEVIHHRQNFGTDGAHTWNLFRMQDGTIYSLDSLWRYATCVDGSGKLNRLYGYDVESVIRKRYSKANNQQAEAAVIAPADSKKVSFQDKIAGIKEAIEQRVFIVGNYCFFQGGKIIILDDGTEKRVPHRVYDIYQAIKDNPPSEALFQRIKVIAEDALANPRRGRDSRTTEFYQLIQNEDFNNISNSSATLRT